MFFVIELFLGTCAAFSGVWLSAFLTWKRGICVQLPKARALRLTAGISAAPRNMIDTGRRCLKGDCIDYEPEFSVQASSYARMWPDEEPPHAVSATLLQAARKPLRNVIDDMTRAGWQYIDDEWHPPNCNALKGLPCDHP